MSNRGWRWPDGTQVLDGPGHGPSELARAGLRAGHVTVRPPLGEARDRRALVPIAAGRAARPGRAAALHSAPPAPLTRQATRATTPPPPSRPRPSPPPP